MSLQYGMNITASDARNMLEKNDKQQSGIRTWRQLFGNASLGYNAQRSALTTDYTDAISQAYATNFRQNDALASAGLASGINRELLSQSRQDLHNAYESYVRNYRSDLSTIESAHSAEVSAINTALTERATNFAHLYQSAYDYLAEELAGAYMTGTAQNGAAAIKDDKNNVTGYEDLDYAQMHGLEWAYDAEGNVRSWEDLSRELLNPDGTLSALGTRFFDQMFNSTYEPYQHRDGLREIQSFDQWLSNRDKTFEDYDSSALPGAAKTSSELREWWMSADPFNFTQSGDNKGSAKAMVGQKSTDDKYGEYEHTVPHKIGQLAAKDFLEKAPLQAFEAAQKAELRAQAYNEKLDREAAHLPNREYKNADAEYTTARNAWHNYYASIDEAYTELDNLLKKTFGSTIANEFWSTHSKYREEHDALMKRARESLYYDETIVGDITKWYKELMTAAQKFSEETYNKRTSGL